jgi:hypothetical protein
MAVVYSDIKMKFRAGFKRLNVDQVDWYLVKLDEDANMIERHTKERFLFDVVSQDIFKEMFTQHCYVMQLKCVLASSDLDRAVMEPLRIYCVDDKVWIL